MSKRKKKNEFQIPEGFDTYTSEDEVHSIPHDLDASHEFLNYVDNDRKAF